MNLFVTKKKASATSAVNDGTTGGHITQPATRAPPKRLWGRKKQGDTKPLIEVVPTLPSLDSFRTSLIMPDLSARFSMLREQDDPFSPLGKASDDSVLQPRRRSRLIDFGHVTGTLNENAEVSSIANPLAGPSATTRKGSYTYGQTQITEDDASTHSIMNRPITRETNTLFGGRQKIYKVSTNAPEPDDVMSRPSPPTMKGRPLPNCEDGMSAFQRYRQDEKQQDQHEPSTELTSKEDLGISQWTKDFKSPRIPPTYDERRETISSTASGPSFISISTIATSNSPSTSTSSPGLPSLNSPQPQITNALERSRSKRLYEQGLAQHLYDQQAAALTRLNSLKQRAPLIGRVPLAPLSQNNPTPYELPENNKATAARKALPALELDKLTTFDSVRRAKASIQAADGPNAQAQPRSPFNKDSETANVLYGAMNPGDRGKATALGTFQKPDKFDEKQYLQRQLSLMQQQRKKRKSTHALSPKKATFPGKPISPSKAFRPVPAIEVRPRAGTTRSDRSWSNSSTQNETAQFTTSRNPEQNTDNNISSSPLAKPNNAAPEEATPTTNDDNSSQYDEEDVVPPRSESERTTPNQDPKEVSTPSRMQHQIAPSSLQKESPPSAVHSPSSPASLQEKRNGWSPEKLASSMAKTETPPKEQADYDWMPLNDENVNSVGEKAQVADLKGLVRAHLRQISNVSTICPSPGARRVAPNLHGPSMYNSENPWDSPQTNGRFSPISPKDSPNPSLHELISHESKQRGVADWDRQLRRKHARGGSSETQHERIAFARELAERQRAIQENLKIKVENESRSPSPPNTNRNVFEHTFKPRGMLRAISSRDSLNNKQETPNKGNKWVDMSAGESDSTRKKRGELATIVTPGREGSPTAGGRTLHSRLHEKPSPKASDIRSKKHRPSTIRESQSERLSIKYSPATSIDIRNATSQEQSSSDVVDEASTVPRVEPEEHSVRIGLTAPDSHGTDEFRRTDDSKQTSQEILSPADAVTPVPETNRPRNGSAVSEHSMQTIDSFHSTLNTRDDEPASSEANGPPNKTVPAVVDDTAESPNTASSGPSHDQPQSPSSAHLVGVSQPTPSSTKLEKRQATSHNGPQTTPSPHSPEPLRTVFPPQHPQALAMRFTDPSAQGGSAAAYYHLRGNWNGRHAGALKKSDISEPRLVASTSTIDTAPLPEGASLKNGVGGGRDVVLAAGATAGHWAVVGREGLGLVAKGAGNGSGHGIGSGMVRRQVGMLEQGAGVGREKKGFLARVGRVGSSEKKAEKALQERLAGMPMI